MQKHHSLYVNSKDTLTVKGPALVKGFENGTFEFEKLNSKATYKETGKFEQGFRVGAWNYEFDGFKQKISWSTFNDTSNAIRFNFFQMHDSVTTGNGYARIFYPRELGNIGATYLLNGQLKDMIPLFGDEQAVRTQFDRLGFKVLKFEMRKMPSGSNDISIVKVQIQSDKTQKISYSNYIYAFVDHDFLELYVDFEDEGNPYADILLNGMLTSLSFKDKRLYNPYLKQETK